MLGIFKQSSLAINTPTSGSALDYRLDSSGGSFVLLSDSVYELSSSAPPAYLPIPEVRLKLSLATPPFHDACPSSCCIHRSQHFVGQHRC